MKTSTCIGYLVRVYKARASYSEGKTSKSGRFKVDGFTYLCYNLSKLMEES